VFTTVPPEFFHFVDSTYLWRLSPAGNYGYFGFNQLVFHLDLDLIASRIRAIEYVKIPTKLECPRPNHKIPGSRASLPDGKSGIKKEHNQVRKKPKARIKAC
jgi:hypothetical protein